MCNQYAVRKSAAEVASHFRVAPPKVDLFNVPEEVFPGYPGMVVREDGGALRLQSMTWGFPLDQKSKRTGLPIKPKTVNNARDDKLMTPFWRSSFENRRCLIPVTHWAEAEGEPGRMTRTWYSLLGADVFAVAGVWRPSDEWGDVYSIVMVDGCEQMADVHDRMPVILQSEDWQRWTQGTPEEALGLVHTCDDALVVDRTADLWVKGRSTSSAPTLL